jgi:hypothetical protein
LPTTTDDLPILYTEEEETKVATRDTVYVGQTGALKYMAHQFKSFVGSAGCCEIEWQGKTSVSATTYPIYLQVFNQSTGLWETKDTNITAVPDVEFEMSFRLQPPTNYLDSSNVITVRIYQQVN